MPSRDWCWRKTIKYVSTTMSLKKQIILITSILALCITCILWLGMQNASVIPMQKAKRYTQSNNDVENDEANKATTIDINNEASLFDELQKNITPDTEHAILHSFLAHWINKNPNTVMRYILDIHNTQLQLNVLTIALKVWHTEKPSALNEWLLTTTPSNTLDHALIKLCNWEDLKPEVALQYAEKISDVNQRDTATIDQLKEWANIDVDQAVSWTIKNDEIYQRFGPAIYRNIIDTNLDLALSSLSLLVSSDLATSAEIVDLINAKIHQLTNNPEYTDDRWIATALLSLPLAQSEFKDMLFYSLAPTVLKQSDTYNSIAFVEAMPAGPTQDSLQHHLVGLLIEHDVSTALGYVSLITDKEKQQPLISTIVKKWAKKDLLASSDWLASLGTAPSDASLALIQTAIQKKNTSIAKKWVKKIKNSPQNTQETTKFEISITALIYEKDPQSASQYLNDIPEISNDDKDILFQYIVNNQTTSN